MRKMYIKVYVDGSFFPENKRGSGGFLMKIDKKEIKESFSLGTLNDSNFAEIKAMEITLQKIKKYVKNYTKNEFIFYVDNKTLFCIMDPVLPDCGLLLKDVFLKARMRLKNELKKWKYEVRHIEGDKNPAHNLAYNFQKEIKEPRNWEF